MRNRIPIKWVSEKRWEYGPMGRSDHCRTPREAGAEERRLICPWCDSDEVENLRVQPHLMVYSYICRSCNSPFEVIKR